jgi:hypothetical protein
VWCRACGRQVEPDPVEMAARYGANTAVLDWHKRLLCFDHFPASESGPCSPLRARSRTVSVGVLCRDCPHQVDASGTHHHVPLGPFVHNNLEDGERDWVAGWVGAAGGVAGRPMGLLWSESHCPPCQIPSKNSQTCALAEPETLAKTPIETIAAVAVLLIEIPFQGTVSHRCEEFSA